MLLGLVVAGCGPFLPGLSAKPPNGTEQMPGPSFVHIIGHPEIASTRLVFGYILPDGATSTVTDVIAAGAPIVVDRTSQPGVHRLTVNGVPCTGSYTLAVGLTVEVVVQIDGPVCSVTVKPQAS